MNKILLYALYFMAGFIVLLGILFSLGLKDYNNALLIVSSLGVFFLGRHLKKDAAKQAKGRKRNEVPKS